VFRELKEIENHGSKQRTHVKAPQTLRLTFHDQRICHVIASPNTHVSSLLKKLRTSKTPVRIDGPGPKT